MHSKHHLPNADLCCDMAHRTRVTKAAFAELQLQGVWVRVDLTRAKPTSAERHRDSTPVAHKTEDSKSGSMQCLWRKHDEQYSLETT